MSFVARKCTVLVLMLIGSVCPTVCAYTFTKVTDSNGAVANFSSAGAAMNASGVVGFMGTLPDEYGNGIFRDFAGGSVSTIAIASGSLTNAFAGSPSINDKGAVAFYNGFAFSAGGVYVGSGGNITTIASTSGPFSQFGPLTYPGINNAGSVVFSARLRDADRDGIFVGNGGAITTIALAQHAADSFGFIPDINSAGTCAFIASTGTTKTVCTGAGGPVISIVDNAGSFSSFSVGASINDAGAVAFGAELDSGDSAVIIASQRGQLVTLADSTGAYDNLVAVPDINDAGTVAFYASLDGGGHGIFTGPDPVRDKVIRSGDALFGSTVDFVGMLRGLNDRGDVAFLYILTDKQIGIAIAAVPEPTTCVCAIGVLICLQRRLIRLRVTGESPFPPPRLRLPSPLR